MEKLQFETTIQASRETIWDAIVNDAKYRFWADEFHPGSFFEGGWNEGDTIHFLGPDEEGNVSGMASEIAKSIYPEHISIRPKGIVSNGQEDTTSDEAKKWSNFLENYTLQKVDAQATRFIVDIETSEEWAPMFAEMWPKALKKLKALSEGSLEAVSSN